jgi:hypothetical protein
MTNQQKKVLRKYPDAEIHYGMNGECHVLADGLNLAAEFCMPGTSSTDVAWEYAEIAARTKQHFDRSHPNRMNLKSRDARVEILSGRRNKGKVNGS